MPMHYHCLSLLAYSIHYLVPTDYIVSSRTGSFLVICFINRHTVIGGMFKLIVIDSYIVKLRHNVSVITFEFHKA